MEPIFVWYADGQHDIIVMSFSTFKSLPIKMRIVEDIDVRFAINEKNHLSMIRVSPGRMHPTMPESAFVVLEKLYGTQYAVDMREQYAYCWALDSSPELR